MQLLVVKVQLVFTSLQPFLQQTTCCSQYFHTQWQQPISFQYCIILPQSPFDVACISLELMKALKFRLNDSFQEQMAIFVAMQNVQVLVTAVNGQYNHSNPSFYVIVYLQTSQLEVVENLSNHYGTRVRVFSIFFLTWAASISCLK